MRERARTALFAGAFLFASGAFLVACVVKKDRDAALVRTEGACFAINTTALEFLEVQEFRRGPLSAFRIELDLFPELETDDISISIASAWRPEERQSSTPATFGSTCVYSNGPDGFLRREDTGGVCGVGPQQETYVRDPGSRSSVVVRCIIVSDRCSMTLFEQIPPFYVQINAAIGAAPSVSWGEISSRIRGFTANSISHAPGC